MTACLCSDVLFLLFYEWLVETLSYVLMTASFIFLLAWSFYFFNFFCQNQGFCSLQIDLQKKKKMNIHNGKRQLFSEFFSFGNPIPPTVWVERKRFHFVHQKNIYLFGKVTAHIRNGSRNLLNSNIELFMMTMSDWKP